MSSYITHKSCSRWYDLSLRAGKTLVVEIHPAVVEDVRNCLGEMVPKSFQRPLPEYVSVPLAPKGAWGYGGIFRSCEPRQEGWTAVACDLTTVSDGQKREPAYMSVNLGLLFHTLWFPPEGVVPEHPGRQFVVITGLLTDTVHQLSGWAISADISGELFRWIKLHAGPSPELSQVMQRTWMRLRRERSLDPWDERHFPAHLGKNGGVYLSVPGNACDLTPTSSFDTLEEIERGDSAGYSLSPHNVDGPFQQLPFLAALAHLCDMARE